MMNTYYYDRRRRRRKKKKHLILFLVVEYDIFHPPTHCCSLLFFVCSFFFKNNISSFFCFDPFSFMVVCCSIAILFRGERSIFSPTLPFLYKFSRLLRKLESLYFVVLFYCRTAILIRRNILRKPPRWSSIDTKKKETVADTLTFVMI